MYPARVRDKIEHGERLRILFLNDVGFQYGAGLAQLRQVQSFLLMGHEVMGICWVTGGEGLTQGQGRRNADEPPPHEYER